MENNTTSDFSNGSDFVALSGNSVHSSDTVTENIRIQVFPSYVPEQSNPEQFRFSFAYRVLIINEGDIRVKLLSRHWQIINADGDQEIVDGPGVVGYSPELEPGESFEYTSHCPINTAWGTMEGFYTMLREDQTQFDALIGRFYLVSDDVLV